MYKNNLLLFSFIIIGSTTFAFATETASSKDQTKTILNAVHSVEVQNIMRRLKLLFYEREYTDLRVQELSKKQIRLLSEEANTLAKTASNLPGLDSLEKLSDEERVSFNALANQLSDITKKLVKVSQTNHQDEIISTYIELQETCNACHQLFRIH
jgi:Cytochrome C'